MAKTWNMWSLIWVYLGFIVNLHASLGDEINNRMAQASIASDKLRYRLWGQRRVKLDTKIQVYKAVMLSIFLYGFETWTPYRSQINQLDVFHQRGLRSISGYTLGDKVLNVDLFARCGIGGIETFLMQSQQRWAGHVVRMSDEQIPKILMYSELKDEKR